MAIVKETNNKFPFLHSHVAKEPYVLEVLEEISNKQSEVIRSGKGTLATVPFLKDSRNIKMPFTHVRAKQIAYIVDTLANNYPEEIKKIFSFQFSADPDTKKLTIDEEVEFTVLCNLNDYRKIQDERDENSLESLHNLLCQFRLFNLTKLIKKTKNRTHLSKLVKSDLGKNIFTFKHFSLDKNSLESAEDYCFHRNNYDSVKESLPTDEVKHIISAYTPQVLRRLQKFGILNAEFNDYRDAKVDYLMNVLLEDIPSSISPKDLIKIKNFNSLRSCILKVEKLIDPLITINNDLMRHIKESGITRVQDILALFDSITDEMLYRWLQEASLKYKILTCKSDGETHIIDGASFLSKLSDLHTLILYNQEEFSRLSQYEKQSLLETSDILCNTGRQLLASDDQQKVILTTDESVSKLKKILKEFDDYKKRISIQENLEREKMLKKESFSILGSIAAFFKSLFSSSKKRGKERRKDSSTSHALRYSLTKESKDIVQSIKESKAKVIPLSSLLVLSEENNYQIDSIIDELRDKNMKTVIPIYNARKLLYPQRSRKYLIPDVEYLLIDPEIVNIPEIIRGFTDALVGEKIKDEIIPASAIMVIEKYLLTVHRQRKAQMKRKAED